MKVILSGCNGTMGQFLARGIAAREGAAVVAGLDIVESTDGAFHVHTAAAQFTESADVIIDFSHPSALTEVITLARSHKLPLVAATTGLSQPQIAQLHDLAKEVPVFFTANMSLGINLLSELVKKAAAVLGNDFDIEIVEKHHNKKVDAPSGTALMLANAAAEGVAYQPTYVYDRQSVRKQRDKTEIGISSVRAGTIVGEHEIIFGGRDEIITLSHTATSKEVFATGAINAAAFLLDKPAGLYSMKDMLA